MGQLITLPELQNKGAGNTATLDIPARGTYNALFLTARDGTFSFSDVWDLIEEIRLKIDGKVQRVYTQAIFDELALLNTGSVTGGMRNGVTMEADWKTIAIPFAEPWRRTARGEDALAWGMADVSTFTIEVDFAAGAVYTDVRLHADWTSANRPLGMIRKFKKFVSPSSGAGEVTYSSLPRIDAITKIILDGNVDRESDLTVDADNMKVFDVEDAATNLQSLLQYGRSSAVGNFFSIIFDKDDRIGSALPVRTADGKGVQSLLLTYSAIGAGNTNIWLEQFGFRD